MGKYVVNPQFDSASDFSGGLAAVSITSGKESKVGFVDKTGKYVVNPQFSSTGNFSDGLVWVSIGEKFSFVDTTGKYVVNPQFDGVDDFVEGIAVLYSKAIDKDGKIIWQAARPEICGD